VHTRLYDAAFRVRARFVAIGKRVEAFDRRLGTIVANDKRVDARRTPGAKPAGLCGRSPLKGLSGIGDIPMVVTISGDEIMDVRHKSYPHRQSRK
jgi:hypothetical protein